MEDLEKLLNDVKSNNLSIEDAKDKVMALFKMNDNLLMNILYDNYELNKQFHKDARKMIYSFSVVHYNETITLNEWLSKYYQNR